MGTGVLTLEDLVVAVYCALDDALSDAGLRAIKGKLIRRRGPEPAVDDREILCLAVLQELLGFESDNQNFFGELRWVFGTSHFDSFDSDGLRAYGGWRF